MPKYYTERISGEDHKPLFQSSIEFQNKKFTGKLEFTKNNAEHSAAYLVLKSLEKSTSVNTDKPYEIPEKYEKVILVDLENNPNVPDILPENAWIMGFTSDRSSTYVQKHKYLSKLQLEVVSSSIKDAADVLLTLKVAELVHSGINKPIIIVTKDHFASAIVDIFKNIHDIKHAVNFNSL